MKKKLFFLLCLSTFCIVLNGCSSNSDQKATTLNQTSSVSPSAEASGHGSAEQTEIQVFVAASLNEAMQSIAEEYKQTNPNVTIRFNADSSGALQTQIEEGFTCDIFFSAATKQMDALNDQGYVITDSIQNLLCNEVALITPNNSGTKVTGFADITNAASFALAGESVPVGQYSRQIFEHLGILEQVLDMEINECKNVSVVKEAIKEGSNEVGTVYKSDAYSIKDSIDIIAYSDPAWLSEPIVYPVALINNPEATELEAQAAKDFLAYLSSDNAKKIFEDYMFTLYNDTKNN